MDLTSYQTRVHFDNFKTAVGNQTFVLGIRGKTLHSASSRCKVEGSRLYGESINSMKLCSCIYSDNEYLYWDRTWKEYAKLIACLELFDKDRTPYEKWVSCQTFKQHAAIIEAARPNDALSDLYQRCRAAIEATESSSIAEDHLYTVFDCDMKAPKELYALKLDETKCKYYTDQMYTDWSLLCFGERGEACAVLITAELAEKLPACLSLTKFPERYAGEPEVMEIALHLWDEGEQLDSALTSAWELAGAR